MVEIIEKREIYIQDPPIRGKVIREKRGWDLLNQEINRSNIKRYPYKQIFGITLTKQILFYREQGLSHEATFFKIINDPRIQKYLENYPLEESNLLDNIKISISARYAESKNYERED